MLVKVVSHYTLWKIPECEFSCSNWIMCFININTVYGYAHVHVYVLYMCMHMALLPFVVLRHIVGELKEVENFVWMKKLMMHIHHIQVPLRSSSFCILPLSASPRGRSTPPTPGRVYHSLPPHVASFSSAENKNKCRYTIIITSKQFS